MFEYSFYLNLGLIRLGAVPHMGRYVPLLLSLLGFASFFFFFFFFLLFFSYLFAFRCFVCSIIVNLYYILVSPN